MKRLVLAWLLVMALLVAPVEDPAVEAPRPEVHRPAFPETPTLVLTSSETRVAGTVDRKTFRSRLRRLHNRARRIRDLALLRVGWRVQKRAQRRAEYLAAQGKLVHSNLKWMLRGVNWDVAGENIGFTTGGPRDLFRAWMDSKSHRQNILDRRYRRFAIGVAQRNGRTYGVVLFWRKAVTKVRAATSSSIEAIVRHTMSVWPRLQYWGRFACRFIAGTSTWSQHAYGRAVDLGVPSATYQQKVDAWLKRVYGRIIFILGANDPVHRGNHTHIELVPRMTGTPECAGG